MGIIEIDTYRYKGHSMSDPGTTYRTRDDVKQVRQSRDPIKTFEQLLMDKKVLSADSKKQIVSEIQDVVKKAVEAAKSDPIPPADAPYEHSYSTTSNIDAIRGIHPWDSWDPKSQ